MTRETDLGGGRKEVQFAETPPISSYLVAYTVGPYEATPVSRHQQRRARARLPAARHGRQGHLRARRARALARVPRGLHRDPLSRTRKVDAIGVPDFEAGAMENPGAITYRLTAIAADAERASTPALKGIYYTAAHELTHMWWGDLVTMAWWDDLWLNESFATFIGYKVVADLMPEWGMWRDFVATLARPFNLDALDSTHPISFEVKNAKQATERFDVITYWKGAGVVRMIEGFLGADAFRTGVRAYLNRYREANATADDFWRELSAASGRDVARDRQRLDQAARPSAAAHRRARRDQLHRAPAALLRRSRTRAGRRRQLWPTPMVIKYGDRRHGVREARVLVDRREQTVALLPDARWFFPNGDGAGFYRFALDDAVARRAWCRSCSRRSTAARTPRAGRQPVGAGQGGPDRRRPVLRHARRLPRRDAIAPCCRRSPNASTGWPRTLRRRRGASGVRALRRELLTAPLRRAGLGPRGRTRAPTIACGAPPPSARSASSPRGRRSSPRRTHAWQRYLRGSRQPRSQPRLGGGRDRGARTATRRSTNATSSASAPPPTTPRKSSAFCSA